MAADQRKKRVNASSLIGCTSREQRRVKMKKLQSRQHDLNMRPNISLEWDNKKQSVVSKRDQVGLSRRHLIPFIEPGHHGHSILADVFSVPAEIFELENLSEVLSYEVWQSHLSEKERSFLSQYLPKEAKPDTIVRDLLAGNNFHFGNPFSKWGTSLCLGEAHPDNVLLEEQVLKAGKKAYYSDLQEYHNNMIRNLQSWKEKWASCKDPEVEILENIWRARKHAKKSVPLSEARFCDSEENLVATPESCSWANSEKAYSSDNQNMGMVYVNSKRRDSCLNKDFTSVRKVLKKGEKLHKRNIEHCDGARYMSYIKVSKEQHERVKSSLKHTGSIQPRSLNNVLGNIDSLEVQPYERFEEEERKKLNEHWLKLACKDIPGAFANWEKRQLQRQQLTWSLGEEIEQKLDFQKATLVEGPEDSSDRHMKVSDNGEKEILPSVSPKSIAKEQCDDLLQEPMDNVETTHNTTTKAEEEKEIQSDFIFEEQGHDTETIEDEPEKAFFQEHNHQQMAPINNCPRSGMMTPSSPGFFGDQHQQIIGSINSGPHSKAMNTKSCGNLLSTKPNEHPPMVSEYPVNLNHADTPMTQGDHVRSASGIWTAGDASSSYYQTTVTNTSTQELSIGHPQFIHEQPVRILGQETDGQGKDAGKNMQHRRTDDTSFLSSYPNQDHNGLLQSFFKGQGDMRLHHQPKQSGLDFHPGNNLLMEASQFPGHLEGHVHASLNLDLKQKRMNDLYMHQNIQESLHSGDRYAMTRHDHLPVSIYDWTTVNNARMPAAHSQLPMNSVEMSQSWYAADSGAPDAWPSFQVAADANHNGLSNGSNSDQTLFSVLTECNGLRPGTSYDSMVPMERFAQAGSYSGMAGGIPSSGRLLQQSPNPLHYLSSHEATSAGIKMNNLGWMGMPQQNSGIPETMGKPFLSSWNQ